MRQIYDFERYTPPVLNEAILREEQKRREKRRQTMLFAFAALLSQAVLLLIGMGLLLVYPALGAVCICYVIISIAGSGAITIIYVEGGLRHE